MQSKYFTCSSSEDPRNSTGALLQSPGSVRKKSKRSRRPSNTDKSTKLGKAKRKKAPNATPFQDRLELAVRSIPVGKVCTFGKIARLIKSDPRWVARAVRSGRKLFDQATAQGKQDYACFYRVITSDLSLDAFDPSEFRHAHDILKSQGIEFDVTGKVQSNYVWDPLTSNSPVASTQQRATQSVSQKENRKEQEQQQRQEKEQEQAIVDDRGSDSSEDEEATALGL